MQAQPSTNLFAFLLAKTMTFNLTLFICSFLLACAMIVRKMWFLRTGKIVAGSYEEADWTDLSIENIRSNLVELLKIAIHRTILFSLKTWILFTHFVKKLDRHVKAKLMHLIHKNGHYTGDLSQKPSEFLSDIKEHKDKMMEGIQKEE